MRCGVVLFDSANNISTADRTFASLDSAWASVAGERAVRVTSIQDLSSDTLWITNLTEEQFYRARLTAHPNFRPEGFLRSSLRHLYSELGADPLVVSPDRVATVLATLAQRVIDFSVQRYGVVPRSRALNEDYAVALNAPRCQIAHDMYGMFAASAQYTYVKTVLANTYENGGLTLTLRRNRLVHARDLLGRPVPPDAPWEYLPRNRLPAEKADIEHMLEQAETAFLVRCDVRNVNPLIADVFSISNGSKVIREWLTDVEWRQAREWADIEYNGLLVCGAPSAVLPQAQALPMGAYDPLSLTCSLASELVWTAMTLRRGGVRDELRHTAAAAWLRAQDRTIMFGYAQQLHAKGLRVWGYGGGNVVVLYPQGGLRHTLDVSTDLGLLAPASKLVEARRDMAGDPIHVAA